jgi:hypothetical protein
VRPRVVSHLSATIHSLFSKSPNFVQRDTRTSLWMADTPHNSRKIIGSAGDATALAMICI